MYDDINKRVCSILNILKYTPINREGIKSATDIFMALNYLIQETNNSDFKKVVYEYIIVMYLVMDKKFMSNPSHSCLHELMIVPGGAYSILKEKIDRQLPIPKLEKKDVIDITATDIPLLRHLYIANRSAVDSIFQQS